MATTDNQHWLPVHQTGCHARGGLTGGGEGARGGLTGGGEGCEAAIRRGLNTFAEGSGVDELMGVNTSNGAAGHVANIIHTCTHSMASRVSYTLRAQV